MNRREPPPLATWMLEHLAAGTRDEALSGDLLEAFHHGKSGGWYWRQVLAACVGAWLLELRVRMPMLAISFLWCAFAPAWYVVCERIQDAPALAHLWQAAGGFWIVPAFVTWLTLHSVFLWTGILLYAIVSRSMGELCSREELRRAMLKAPLIFAPAFAVAFVFVSLYRWSAFPNARLALTPLAQIADFGRLADVLRLPYFVAMVTALWGMIPRSERARQEMASEWKSKSSEASASAPTFFPALSRRSLGFLVCTGLLNSLIGAYLVCRLPQSNTPERGALFLQATIYVAIGALTGVLGTWLYWRRLSKEFNGNSKHFFRLFALMCAVGWIWVPAMVLFSEQLSPLAAVAAVIGASLLTVNVCSSEFAKALAGASSPSLSYADRRLFDESLFRPAFELHGYVIAISLYAAFAALFKKEVDLATACFALTASVFLWKHVIYRQIVFSGNVRVDTRRAARRLLWASFPAVLVTAWALLNGIAHRAQATSASVAGAAVPPTAGKKATRAKGFAFSGYESVILWPYQKKQQIIVPISSTRPIFAPGSTEPLVIPFDGPYWFLQPPEDHPGPTAHNAHGLPVDVDIRSNNAMPLEMVAHQSLSAPIPLARCREIEVEIENLDNTQGMISLALAITDHTLRRPQTFFFNGQLIVSTEPENFSYKRAPVFETLRFVVPVNAEIRKFSEIAVQMLPDIQHRYVAPRIAVVQFRIVPR